MSGATYPTAAVIECAACGTAYVLRWCLILSHDGTEECYAFFPDCQSKRRCEADARRSGVERKRVRRDAFGGVRRIPVRSAS